MLNAAAEFDRRNLEIDEYLAHLELLEKSSGTSVTLINTMKSSALLMTYNVIESTMTNLLQDVFDHLQAQNIGFDSLNDKMKELVLSFAKRHSPSKLVEKMKAQALDIVIACFDRSDVFSGNLDAREIRDTMKRLGIKTTHAYTEAALLNVKTERNNLAHGSKSFSDCGKSYTAGQLRDIHKKTIGLLGKAIIDFESFLNAQAYA
ncbi:MAG TPA: MAE_28990/MAE_18760 family HEPN-like nuclease [Burkholderiaceae bacterium]|jgi:hypothetical protein